MTSTEWSIREAARAAGTTSRTLRHYDDQGVLTPSRVGRNGYRYYNQDDLLRLQRILLLRELGLSLSAIADVLAGQQDTAAALHAHLELLEQEQDRLQRQIASVRTTLRKTKEGEPLVATELFDGFDHTQYEDEVVARWGREAYDASDRWWRSLDDAGKRDFQQRQADIAAEFGRAYQAGQSTDDDDVQAITRRHYDWVAEGWQSRRPNADQFTGLGQLYADDPRFAATYDQHGEGTVTFVRDAMRVYAERNLA